MPKYTVNNHSVLNVSNEEAKNGASWHDLARERAFKQHGDAEELPEGDIHAIRKHPDHHLPQLNPEEEKHALDALEDQIKHLQATENEKAQARNLAKQQQNQQSQNHYEDDPYDDWFKE